MLLHACAAVVTALSLLGGAAAHAAEPEGELAHRLEAIVRIHADVPAEARTAAYLGTTRDGAGAVIDDGGLIVTIGYLITEAMGAEVTKRQSEPRGYCRLRHRLWARSIACGRTVGGEADADRIGARAD